jgi:hypothetical protein
LFDEESPILKVVADVAKGHSEILIAAIGVLSLIQRAWLAHAPKTRGSLKLEVDIDPQSFY